MALTKVIGSGVGTLASNVAVTSDDPTITMTDSSGTNDIVTLQSTSGALIVTARDGSSNGEIIFKADTGSAVTEHMRINNIGAVTKPLQPAFQARPATNQSDIAINGNREVVFGTEVFDNNSDFSSNTFTAPVTGKYLITYSLYLQNLDSAANYYEAFINTSNRTYYGSSIDPDFADADFNYFSLSSSCVVDMDANDTATININQSQGTAQTDIASPSFFSGALIC